MEDTLQEIKDIKEKKIKVIQFQNRLFLMRERKLVRRIKLFVKEN